MFDLGLLVRCFITRYGASNIILCKSQEKRETPDFISKLWQSATRFFFMWPSANGDWKLNNRLLTSASCRPWNLLLVVSATLNGLI